MAIEIRTDEIDYAERILLRNDEKFDAEQKAFISNYNTIDLQAVPGSGKTSALLAKLLILEKRLPFDDGSGILVLSHTNSAIDEIESKIKKHCPKLFAYPNFVGTIQSFVDKFLAIPACINHYGIRPTIIDSITFENILVNMFKLVYWDADYQKPGAWLYNRYKTVCKGNRNCIDAEINKFIKKIRYNLTKDEVVNVSDSQPIINDQENPKNKAFKFCFEAAISYGYLPYDFAYELSRYYTSNYAVICQIIKSRFKCVFIDEMQDMDQPQVDLLNNLFYNPTAQDFCYQRIGDKNQAIFHSSDFYEGTHWNSIDRTTLPLSGSHRLTPSISKVVEKFGIEYTAIMGLNTLIDTLPIIILYKEEKVEDVIPLFATIVKSYIEENGNHINNKYPIKAIGWRKTSGNGIALTNYFREYKSILSLRKNMGDSLWADMNESYLASQEYSAFKPIYKSIIKSIYYILRIENYNKIDQIKSPATLEIHFQTLNEDEYLLFQKFLVGWCQRIVLGELDPVFIELKTYIKEKITRIFGIAIKSSVAYLENKQFEPDIKKQKIENIYIDDNSGIQIEVCTVHSAKGETHLATLYLETYFHNDAGKSYESQRLKKFLCGEFFNETGKRKKQSAKMVYVGFSRAKYLLCYAANFDHFTEEDLTQIAAQGWEINRELCN